MRKDVLHEPFELVLKEFLDVCPRGEHAHSFFELVYVVAGTGQQVINQHAIGYRAGDLFLLAPNDQHSFDIDNPTQFFFVRFNPPWVTSDDQHREFVQRLESILRLANNIPGNIVTAAPDRALVHTLMDAIIQEHISASQYHHELTRQLVHAVLVVIARNIGVGDGGGPVGPDPNTDDRAAEILQYIQTNIFDPEKLRIEQVGSHFGISETYLGHYFKRHFSESYQQYITRYKFKLIEDRLLHTDKRMNEIADEFGFTDTSHFNRMFKKHAGMNPSAFKKKDRA